MKRNFWIDKVNKKLVLDIDYNQELINDIKGSGYGTYYNAELKLWYCTISDYSLPILTRLLKNWDFKITVDPDTYEEDVVADYSIDGIDLAYLSGMCHAKDFGYKARDYQLEALGYGIKKGSFINGDDVGLGKTFESILYVETQNLFPCLVVTPASVKYNWAEKWKEITKGRVDIAIIESKETKARKNNWDADVVVINYDIIGKKQGTGATVNFPELLSKNWKCVIADEAHFLKEKKSQRSKAFKKISEKVRKANGIVQLLTGTATMNKPIELWNLLKLIGKDADISTDWYAYVRRYCNGYKGKFGWVTDGATKTLELNKKLRDTCYIRREKSQVLDAMPSLTKQTINLPITNSKEYNFAETDLINYITETKGEEAADKAAEAEHLVMIGTLRKLSIEGKEKAIVQYLKDWKDAGNGKLLVFGLHRDTLKMLSEKFKCDLIAGGVSSEKKQAIVKKWQNDDNIFLFGNIQSAGTGIDGLQNVCSNMLILELPWRVSDLSQAFGRLHRSGQLEPVIVTFLLSEQTIDTQMMEMLSEKEIVTEAVNKGIDITNNENGLKAVFKKLKQKNK